jgi:hypothetical protein
MSQGRTSELAKVIGKRRWSESDAGIVVTAWKRSGTELSEFARENGVNAQRLHRWCSRAQGRVKSKGVRFHPVRLVGGDGAGIEVVLLDGRRVRVREGFSSEELGRVLEVLEGRG